MISALGRNIAITRLKSESGTVIAMSIHNKKVVEVAEKYLKLGYSIIPVGKNKVPLVDWKEYQSRRPTLEEVKKWLTMFPYANIGIITGKISNLAVVDIEKGGDVKGLPMTKIVRTGGGGWHYYFKYAEGVENKTRVRELTDIRGEGGYVVAPPSIHESGEEYFWVDEEAEIVDFPDHLKPMIFVSRRKNWSEAIAGVGQGKRNATAAQIFGILIPAFGRANLEQAWELGRMWNERNNPPLSKKELRSVCESIAKTHYSKQQKDTDYLPISLTELMKKEFGEIKWLVENIIPDSGLVVISGNPGGYKTWLILEIAIKVAKGIKFLDTFLTQKNGVLLVDEENGLRILKNRLVKLKAGNDLPIHFLSYAGFKITADSVRQLVEFCKKNNIKLVFFDSLVRIHNVDENSAGEMASVFGHLRVFSKEGIAVVFTHHNRKAGILSGKPSQEIRGSSDILASVDSHLAIERKEDTIIFRQTKLREAIEIKPFSVLVESTEEAVKFTYTGEIDEGKKNKDLTKEAVLKILEDNEKPMFQKEIVQALKEQNICGESTAEKFIKQLVEEKKIYKEKGEKNKIYYTLQLPTEEVKK